MKLCVGLILFAIENCLTALCRYILSTLKLILTDTSKFKKIQIDGSKVLNNLIHGENKIVDLLKRLKNKKFLIKKYRFKTRYFIRSLYC